MSCRPATATAKCSTAPALANRRIRVFPWMHPACHCRPHVRRVAIDLSAHRSGSALGSVVCAPRMGAQHRERWSVDGPGCLGHVSACLRFDGIHSPENWGLANADASRQHDQRHGANAVNPHGHCGPHISPKPALTQILMYGMLS